MTESVRKTSIDNQEASFSNKTENKLQSYQKVNKSLNKLKEQERKLQEQEQEELKDIENWLESDKERIMINLENIQTPPEIQEKLDKLNQNRRQLELMKEVAVVYQSYLSSILSDIKYKTFSQKDERYEEQIKTIKEKLSEIKLILEDTTLLGLQTVNIEELVNQIFVSEEDIAQTGRLDHFFQSPEEANQRYEEIRKLITNLGNGDNILETKIKIFELIRENEWLDDDKHKYNSGKSIQRNLAEHILENKELRQQKTIDIYFQILEEIRTEETKKKKLEENTNKEEDLYQIMREFGVFLPRKETREIYKEIKEYKEEFNMEEKIKQNREKILGEIEKYINKIENKEESEEERKKWNNPELQEKIKNNLLETLNEIYREEVYKIAESHIINWQLERNRKEVSKLRENNDLLKIYTEIEGIGNKIWDKAYNNIVDKSEFIGTQIALMYISGIGQIWMRAFMSKWIETTAKMTAKQLATQSYILWAEWLAFYWIYELWNSLAYYKGKENFQEEMQQLNITDWARITIFLWILRSLPLSSMWKHLDKIKTKEVINLPNLDKIVWEVGRKWMNITLDTTALLGTDITVKAIFQEDLPKNKEEIIKFLQKELEFIIPLVIGLRWAENIWKVWEIWKKPIFANKEKKSNIVVEIKDKKVIVDGVEIEIRGRLKWEKEMKEGEEQSLKKEVKKSDSPIKENSNWEIDMRAKKLGMEPLKLEEMMKWFELETRLEDGITERFTKLLERFKELWDKGEIEQEVRKTIEEEIENIKGSLEWESVVVLERMRQEWDIVKRLTKEFVEALEKRVRKEKFDDSYGEASFMERVMDLYVREIRDSVKDEFTEKTHWKENKKKD